MKKSKIIAAIMAAAFAVALWDSCVSAKIAEKSGSQLWSENCQRCHNTPPSSAFADIQWDVVNTHMRQRAMMTQEETEKVLEFLQSGE